MIVIVNLELGNILSIENMVRYLGFKCCISNNVTDINKASHLILPGVGSFDYGMSKIEEFGLNEILKDKAISGVPTLGICLGMQLLGKKSEEGIMNGLGLIDINFHKFKITINDKLRIPHVGWNKLEDTKKNILFNTDELQKFYFTHSYYGISNNDDNIIAKTNHGTHFASVINNNNIYGVQFHPEKSHTFGKNLIFNFLKYT